MPINPTYTIQVIGSNSKVKSMTFDGQEISDVDLGTEMALAHAALEAIVLELRDVTDANIHRYYVSVDGTGTVGGVPANADVFEEAVMSLDVAAPGEPTKLATRGIPAPSLAIFQSSTGPGRDVLDTSDADVVAYVAALQANVLISDGEEIASLVSGFRRANGRRTS